MVRFIVIIVTVLLTACGGGGGSNSGSGSGNPIAGELFVFQVTPLNANISITIFESQSLREARRVGNKETARFVFPGFAARYEGYVSADNSVAIGEKIALEICTGSNVYVGSVRLGQCRVINVTRRSGISSPFGTILVI